MTNDYPKLTNAAKKGEQGVAIVSRVINEEFGWVFRRNHQEHDFGIDGQIDVVTDAGNVTGQILAIQIKCGASFLSEANDWGYVYRGELKHFNYLSNYPVPVVIALCDPDSKVCYWAHFRIEETRRTKNGWKLTIPFNNKLTNAKSDLLALLPEVKDSLKELESYWALNDVILGAGIIALALGPEQVDTSDVDRPREFFDRLRETKELARHCQGKVEISFSGYDDSVELFEVEAVKAYVCLLADSLYDLFYFVRTEEPTFTLRLFTNCVADAEWLHKRGTPTQGEMLKFDRRKAADFMEKLWPGLNELTAWTGMSMDDNKRITRAIGTRVIGVEIPELFEVDLDK